MTNLYRGYGIEESWFSMDKFKHQLIRDFYELFFLRCPEASKLFSNKEKHYDFFLMIFEHIVFISKYSPQVRDEQIKNLISRHSSYGVKMLAIFYRIWMYLI